MYVCSYEYFFVDGCDWCKSLLTDLKGNFSLACLEIDTNQDQKVSFILGQSRVGSYYAGGNN